jgi:malonyl CoA-acyl carrier protein transacylase
MKKRAALVVCPGRGTYGKTELGYLRRHHRARDALIAEADAFRRQQRQVTISEMDGRSSYDLDAFTRGDNAATLIYVCSIADFAAIDRGRFDVIAVTGNSMGWYTALACAGALSPQDALQVVNTMGSLTHQTVGDGGQVLHTFMDEDWREAPELRQRYEDIIRDVNAHAGCALYPSIRLGGMLVAAGNEAGLAAFVAQTPAGPAPYPMRLHNHGPFHTPLMQAVAARARAELTPDLFQDPRLPLIDGRGRIWRKRAADLDALWDYTFGEQVTAPYDFTSAIRVGVREFAPDCIILLGPGGTLGSAVAQSLIKIGWRGLGSKATFTAQQEADPFVLSMGRDTQRGLVVTKE